MISNNEKETVQREISEESNLDYLAFRVDLSTTPRKLREKLSDKRVDKIDAMWRINNVAFEGLPINNPIEQSILRGTRLKFEYQENLDQGLDRLLIFDMNEPKPTLVASRQIFPNK